jgi:Icc-related predicted phosphoesterase
MKVHILSDLHTEMTAPFVPSKRTVAAADLIVLAGDIGVGTQGVAWAIRTFPGKQVLYAIGNHEFYGGNISRTAIEIRKAAAGSNVTVLDNDSVILDGVRFLGCTLWTDFKLFGDSPDEIAWALHAAKYSIADFSTITFGTTGWMTPAQSVILHDASIEWLDTELAKPFDGKTVVITHHAPSIQSVEPRFAAHPATPAFASRLDHLVAQANLWIHGHTHCAFDYRIGDDPEKGRVVCNPRGYMFETRGGHGGETTGFLRKLLVEI